MAFAGRKAFVLNQDSSGGSGLEPAWRVGNARASATRLGRLPPDH